LKDQNLTFLDEKIN